jgi:ABC-type sugar transport system ATPase subunit
VTDTTIETSQETPASEILPLVRVRGVGKRYGPIEALKDVSVDFHAGEIHALCGHNGAGKSTLVKMIAGLVKPDAGEVLIDGTAGLLGTPQAAQRSGIAIVDQELTILPELSVAENLLLGRLDMPVLSRRGRDEARASELLENVGLGHLDPRQRGGTLSLGERQRLEVARALGRNARFVVLDEPTATLSDVEIEAVFDAVRQAAAAGAGVLFVSHRLGEVLSLCDRVTVMRDGQHVTTAPASSMDRSQLIDLMLGEAHGTSDRASAPAYSGEDGDRVEIRDLTVPSAVDDFSLDVQAGQIVALAGQVGSGASEVLRALAGLEPTMSGSVRIAGKPVDLRSPRRALRSGVVIVSNDRKNEGLFLQHTVAKNLAAIRLDHYSSRFLGILRRRAIRRGIGELGAAVGVGTRLETPVGQLSGGNQQKAFVGRCLDHKDVRLLMLDEPTRGVDVGGRSDIHELVRAAARSGNAVILCSTELDEILDLADVVVTMFRGRVVSTSPRHEMTGSKVLAEMTHQTGQDDA